jgi:hypothetical protein
MSVRAGSKPENMVRCTIVSGSPNFWISYVDVLLRGPKRSFCVFTSHAPVFSRSCRCEPLSSFVVDNSVRLVRL